MLKLLSLSSIKFLLMTLDYFLIISKHVYFLGFICLLYDFLFNAWCDALRASGVHLISVRCLSFMVSGHDTNQHKIT